MEQEQLEELIIQKLREVIDPEVNLNVVDMGLIYGLNLKDGTITVEMTLTTPGCPMKDYMRDAVHEALRELEGIKEVIVDFVWEPPWTPDKIDHEAIERMNRGEI